MSVWATSRRRSMRFWVEVTVRSGRGWVGAVEEVRRILPAAALQAS